MTRNKLLRIKVELEERVDGQTDELAKTGARLKTLIDGSLKGIYLHIASRPVLANHALGPMLGVENPEKFLPFSPIFNMYAKGDQERVESNYRIRTAYGESPNTYGVPRRRPDGILYRGGTSRPNGQLPVPTYDSIGLP